MPELITYQTYALAAQAEEVAERLQQEGIPAKVIKSIPKLEVYIGKEYGDKYLLMLFPDDFSRANKILFNDAEAPSPDIDPSDPLQNLSDEELKDVISKPDEWGPDNYNVALAILKNRGAHVSDSILQNLQEERIKVRSQRKPFNFILLVISYFLALLPFIILVLRLDRSHTLGNFDNFFVPFFPCMFGLVVGVTILASFNTLPDGQRVPVFDSAAIKHGRILLALSALSVAGYILLFIV